MDDLEFRRAVYANPKDSDEALKQAVAGDDSRQQFWNEVQALDDDIIAAAKVPVPDDLAHRILLQQSLSSHQQHRRKSRVYLALAASVAFVFGASFMLLQQQPQMADYSRYALAHVHHEGDYPLQVNHDVPLSEVNAKLASFGGRLTAAIGKVYFSNYCFFENKKSLHLVLEGDNGEKVTVFVLGTEDGMDIEDNFHDDTLHGQAVQLEKANLFIVGDKNNNLEGTKARLLEKLQFSA